MLANRLAGPVIWFTTLGNGVAGLVNGLVEATNRLVTLTIWFTWLAMQLAGLTN